MAALLLPALQKAKREARLIMCMSNLKQVGLGLSNYTCDNDLWYPSRSWPQVSNPDNHIQVYKGRLYMKADRLQCVNYFYDSVLPYYGGGGTSMGDIYTCPFARNELIASSTNNIFPYTDNDWFGGIGNYSLYFEKLWRDSNSGAVSGGARSTYIREPMRKLGECWRMGSGGWNGTANILVPRELFTESR